MLKVSSGSEIEMSFCDFIIIAVLRGKCHNKEHVLAYSVDSVSLEVKSLMRE